MAQQFQQIGEAFTRLYYTQFDSNRASLQSLYREQSMMTFEGSPIMGAESIVRKLVELPFQKVQHHVVTCDCQPTTAVEPNGIIVSVSGSLVLDGSQDTPVKFAQCFHLLPDPSNPGNFWVHNDIFRLNYG